MGVAFKNKISTRLAKQTVAIAFVVGLCLSSFQVYLDYQDHGVTFDQSIEQMLSVSFGSATRSVRTLDNSLAEEVVNGLMHYEFIQEVKIIDDLGVVLAKKDRPLRVDSSTLWITNWLVPENKQYIHQLAVDQSKTSLYGQLVLTIDKDLSLAPFYQRLVYVVSGGIIRNMLLALILFYVFYYVLTAPMTRVAQIMKRTDPLASSGTRLSEEIVNRGDELGAIA